MRARFVIAVAGACALAFGVAGCTTTSGTEIKGNALTIYSSLPLQGPAGERSAAIANGAKLALRDLHGKIGKYRINYVSLDDSTAARGAADDATVSGNARRAVSDSSAVGYLGDYNSGATAISLPILNQAGIAQVSPSNTYEGLTTNAAGTKRGEPDLYYPKSKRTYARIVPRDSIQGAALASAAKGARCRSIHIWNTRSLYGAGLAIQVQSAAKKLGLAVEGNDGIDPRAASYGSQAQAIKSDCFVFTGEIEFNGARAIADVGAARPKIKLFGGDGVVFGALADPGKGLPAAIASRFEGTIAALAPSKLPSSGKKLLADYKATYHSSDPDPYAIYGFESMSLLLESIKQAESSHGGKVTREDVVKALFNMRDRQSVLGTYSIDSNGDTTTKDYGLYRIAGGKLKFERVVKGA